MNILFFCVHPIVATEGGISRISDSLIQIFRNNGHNVFILSEKRETITDDEWSFCLPNNNYDEMCLSYVIDLCKDSKIDLIINQSSLNKRVVFFFEKMVNKYPIRICSCIHNCTKTPILNYAYQKEFFLRQHKMSFLFYVLKTKFAKKILLFLYILKYKKLYSKLAKISESVVVLDEKLIPEFQIFIPKKYYNKIKVAPNCLPIRNWNCNEEKKKIILWVASVNIEVKRIDLILNAWKEIYLSNPEWNLFILGDGPNMGFAKDFVKKHNIQNISFEGRVNPFPYYEKASLLAVTSTHESFSLVIIEAQQHKVVPVVINSFPVASTLIQDGINGILVNQFDYRDFAKNMNRLMKNEALLKKVSSTCQENIFKYSPEYVYNTYWKKILG